MEHKSMDAVRPRSRREAGPVASHSSQGQGDRSSLRCRRPHEVRSLQVRDEGEFVPHRTQSCTPGRPGVETVDGLCQFVRDKPHLPFLAARCFGQGRWPSLPLGGNGPRSQGEGVGRMSRREVVGAASKQAWRVSRETVDQQPMLQVALRDVEVARREGRNRGVVAQEVVRAPRRALEVQGSDQLRLHFEDLVLGVSAVADPGQRPRRHVSVVVFVFDLRGKEHCGDTQQLEPALGQRRIDAQILVDQAGGGEQDGRLQAPLPMHLDQPVEQHGPHPLEDEGLLEHEVRRRMAGSQHEAPDVPANAGDTAAALAGGRDGDPAPSPLAPLPLQVAGEVIPRGRGARNVAAGTGRRRRGGGGGG
mmetsp:Transcript_6995/g.19840  ORF Transcript_6995/g.19840 Transcript_6995/m.19840 type:complete len:362 (+) Transcript_6995:3-1088(+)